MKIDRKKIAEIIKEKGATRPCHRCSKNQFSILDGYSSLNLQDDIPTRSIVIGGKSVPVVLIVCNNCGAITSHALGALDLLPKDEEGKADEQ